MWSSWKRFAVRLAACWLLGATGAAADEPPHPRTRDVIYGRKAGMALTMDVFRPKGKGNGAALLWLASGDWVSDIGRSDRPPQPVAELLRRDYVVFYVGHSSFPAFALDEIVPDLHRAVRFIRNHAGEYGVDPERLAIAGVSSGGHLAAHVGVGGGKGPAFPTPDLTGIGRYDPVEREPSRVAAFISFCGPTDLVNYEAEGKSILTFRLPEAIRKQSRLEYFPITFRNFHRKSVSFSPVTDPDQVQRRLKAISPALLVSADSSPGLLVHGADDPNVPVRQAEALAGAMKAAGVPIDLVVRKGVGHDVYRHGDDKLIADWLDRRLGAAKPGAR